MQLKQMGHAHERDWARILRKYHLANDGLAPPVSIADDPTLRPH